MCGFNAYFGTLLLTMKIRAYKSTDAEAILSIYAPFIIAGPVTFETDVPALSDFQRRLSAIAENFPFFVLEEDGQIQGYAYASKYRERAAYRWHVETSIYMHESARGKGRGLLLYRTLLNELTRRKFTRAYAIVGLPNEPSEQFHRNCGFLPLVTHTQAGWKQGKWRDVLWLTKDLHPAENPPQEPEFGPLNTETAYPAD